MGVPLAGQNGDVPSVHAGNSHTLSSFQIWHWNHEIERCKAYFLPTKRTILQTVAVYLVLFSLISKSIKTMHIKKIENTLHSTLKSMLMHTCISSNHAYGISIISHEAWILYYHICLILPKSTWLLSH